MKTICFIRTILVVPLLYFQTVAYSDSCESQCLGKGYTEWDTAGTAPFCDGDCDSVFSGGYGYNNGNYIIVDDVGESTDGSSCWSGTKRCCCRQVMTKSCSDACKEIGWAYSRCVGLDGGHTTPLLGWCNTTSLCQCMRLPDNGGVN